MSSSSGCTSEGGTGVSSAGEISSLPPASGLQYQLCATSMISGQAAES